MEELLVKEKSKQNKSRQLRGSRYILMIEVWLSHDMSSVRHSRFGGSYEVKPTLSGEKRVHHKPLSGHMTTVIIMWHFWLFYNI